MLPRLSSVRRSNSRVWHQARARRRHRTSALEGLEARVLLSGSSSRKTALLEGVAPEEGL